MKIKLTKGRILAIAAAAVVVIAAAVAGIVLANQSNYVLRGDVLTLLYDRAYNKTATMYNRRVIWDEGFYCDGYVKAYTVDLAGDAIMAYNEKNGSLYHFGVSGVKAISSDVANFVMSDDGRRFAWTSTAGKIQIFNGSSVKDVTEAGDLYNFAMSPKGKYLLYVANSGGKDAMMLYNATDRKSVKLREEMYPLALDDDAKFIYCVSADGVLMCLDSTGRTVNSYSAFTGKNVYLNTSHRQIVFGDEGGATYAVVDGGEAHRVGSSEAVIVLPEFGAYTYNVTTVNAVKVYTFGVKNVFGCVYFDGGSRLCYVDDKFNISTVADGVESVSMSDNGRTVYYVANRTLYKAKGRLEGSAQLDIGVSRAISTPDGSKVYYLTVDNGLRFYGGSVERIAENCGFVQTTRTNGAIYMTGYDTDELKGSLYYTTNGRAGKLLNDKCYDCWADMSGTFYIFGRRELDDGSIDYDVKLWGASGDNFEELYKDIWDIQNYTFTY